MSFSRSPCIIFDTGMPVARDTTSAISAPTWVRSSFGFAFSVDSASWARELRQPAVLQLRSLSYWPFLCSSAICWRSFSISSLMCWLPWTCAFSAFHSSSRSA